MKDLDFKLSQLKPESRRFFFAVIREFAVDCGAARQVGLEKAEEIIIGLIRSEQIKLFYDKELETLTLEVI